MSEQNNKIHPDAPGGWEGYSQLLRKHGKRSLSSKSAKQMEEEWRNQIAARQKARQRRWQIGLPTSAVLVVGIIFLVNGLLSNKEPVALPIVYPSVPEVVHPEPDIFANPAIPPVWYDSTMPLVETELPAMPLDSGLFELDTELPTRIDTPVAGEPVR